MSDLEDAVAEFLQGVDKVYKEYNKGYMDADAALSRLDDQIETLREQADSE